MRSVRPNQEQIRSGTLVSLVTDKTAGLYKATAESDTPELTLLTGLSHQSAAGRRVVPVTSLLPSGRAEEGEPAALS